MGHKRIWIYVFPNEPVRERGETLEGAVGDHSVLSGGQESRQTLDALWQTGLVGLNFGAKPGQVSKI